MHILFYTHPLNYGSKRVIQAMSEGLKRHGETSQVLSQEEVNADDIQRADAVFVHNVIYCKESIETCRRLGVHFIYYDKGYFGRAWNTTDRPDATVRFCVNGFHPHEYLQEIKRPADRWNALEIELKPRHHGDAVVFAGCSQGFADWYHFNIHDYAVKTAAEIRRFSDRPIVYRPKKSFVVPQPITGTTFSHMKYKIEEELQNAHALVTFASNASVDAILHGVPAFVLGPAAALPVSNTYLSQLESPYFPTDAERYQWACNLAYCQWQYSEMSNGLAWQNLKEILGRFHEASRT